MKEIHPAYHGVTLDETSEYEAEHPEYPIGMVFGEGVPGDKLHIGTIISSVRSPYERYPVYYHDPLFLIEGLHFIKRNETIMWHRINDPEEMETN